MTKRIDFPQWLQNQMDERGWGQAELAKRSKVNRQVIWSYLNRRRNKPDEDVLKKIAEALEIPVEQIYRAAGILSAEEPIDLISDTIIHLLRDLDRETKNEIVEYVKLKRRLRKKDKDN